MLLVRFKDAAGKIAPQVRFIPSLDPFKRASHAVLDFRRLLDTHTRENIKALPVAERLNIAIDLRAEADTEKFMDGILGHKTKKQTTEEAINLAAAMFESIIEEDPQLQNPETIKAAQHLSLCYTQQGRGEKNVKMWQYIVKIKPDDDNALCYYASALIANFRFKEAQPLIQTALKRSQDPATRNFALALHQNNTQTLGIIADRTSDRS
jgi:tetratricopeptide (TPR) repeat protein